MSLRDERNPPPEPTPLTAEESTKEIRTLKGTTTALWVVLILAVVGLSLVQVFKRGGLSVAMGLLALFVDTIYLLILAVAGVQSLLWLITGIKRGLLDFFRL